MLPKKGEPRKVTIDESKTVLGSNAVFKGELTFNDTLCIDGEFEGKLTTSDKLIVAEQGAVLADIECWDSYLQRKNHRKHHSFTKGRNTLHRQNPRRCAYSRPNDRTWCCV